MQEVYEFLKKCETYYLATVDGDQPRVRPFGTVNVFEGRLYIQTGKVKAVSKELAANPKLEICAYNGEQWLRVSATAVEDDRVEARQDMLDHYRRCTRPTTATRRCSISRTRPRRSARLPPPRKRCGSDHRPAWYGKAETGK